MTRDGAPRPERGERSERSERPERPRIKPVWWPEGEEWPPRRWRYGNRHGRWGDRRHRGPRPFGCLFLILILLVAGLLTSAFWSLAAIAGFVSAPPVVTAGGLVVTLLVLVAAGATFASIRRATAPIDDLAAAAERIESGDYSTRVEERGSKSTQGLVRAFNQMSSRLQALDQGRRIFLADVAHELRTPLSVITGQLEAIEDGVYPADAEHLEPIREQIKALEKLIDDMRIVALAEAGGLTLMLAPTDLTDLLTDQLAAFSAQAGAAGVTLLPEIAAGLPFAMADEPRVRQVVANLLANALRHTPAGGRVTLSARASVDGDTLTVEVADTGRGIDFELLPRVFDRFVKGQGSAGSGLGLAICRDIIEAHGGDISIASEPSRGTTLTFSLPAVAT
ncbi:MAG TPA: ATP-binding protein [Candidatus Limnocylindrales bacterium]|jgi:signal transduction histidine kinase